MPIPCTMRLGGLPYLSWLPSLYRVPYVSVAYHTCHGYHAYTVYHTSRWLTILVMVTMPIPCLYHVPYSLDQVLGGNADSITEPAGCPVVTTPRRPPLSQASSPPSTIAVNAPSGPPPTAPSLRSGDAAGDAPCFAAETTTVGRAASSHAVCSHAACGHLTSCLPGRATRLVTACPKRGS